MPSRVTPAEVEVASVAAFEGITLNTRTWADASPIQRSLTRRYVRQALEEGEAMTDSEPQAYFPAEVVDHLRKTSDGIGLLSKYLPQTITLADRIEAELSQHQYVREHACSCRQWFRGNQAQLPVEQRMSWRTHVARAVETIVREAAS